MKELPDYEKQVYAAVLGKTIGVYMGRPFEGWWKDGIENKWGTVDRYVNGDLGKPLVVADDDISGTFTFVKALSDFPGNPRDVTPEFFGETWRNYLLENRTILWWGGVSLSTEHTAWMRLKQGLQSPETGSAARNGKIVSEQIGAQIFIDAFGMVAPGDPDLAERFADGAARVSHDGEAVLAAKVVARMVAAAFVEKDMEKVLDAGEAHLPPESLVAQVHRDVRAWRREDGDWRKTYDRIFEKYGYKKYGGNCHVIPNHALMVMAWSYAGNDFFEAQRIVNTAGWDTDCNAANVGTVSALVAGLDRICEKYDFRSPFADRIVIPTADGTDSATDCLRVSRAIAALGRRVMGWNAAPPQVAIHSFEQPGSLQGWMPEKDSPYTVENVERPPARAVLFDLDGTLLYTIDGLASAVNHVMRFIGEPEHTHEEVRSFINNGIRKLVARAVPGGEDRADFETLVSEFRAHYEVHATDGMRPYPGIPETLAQLKARGVALAVVTNKDESISREIVERFFPGTFSAVVGGSAGRPPKPDPSNPRAALEALGVAADEALYVGDSAIDAATARGAGIPLALCAWGYTEPEILRTLGPVSESAEELLRIAAGPLGRALRVGFSGPCTVSTPVSLGAGDPAAGGYLTPNAPWLYRGMTAAVAGRAADDVPAGTTLRAFARHSKGAVSRCAPVALHAGEPFELRWKIDGPEVPPEAILDFGLEIECPKKSGAASAVFVHSLACSGTVSFDWGESWCPCKWSDRLDGWIDGMDRQLGAFSDDPEPQRRFGSDWAPCVYVTGNRTWGDQSLACRFNVHAADRAGLVLRWQGMRRHYAFVFGNGRAALVRQNYGETVLAEAPFAIRENEMVSLVAKAEGTRISLEANGSELIAADDPAFATGGVGFIVQGGLMGVAKPSVRAKTI